MPRCESQSYPALVDSGKRQNNMITLLYIGRASELLWYLNEVADQYNMQGGRNGVYRCGLGGSFNGIIYHI